MTPPSSEAPIEFSLVAGGPLFRLCLRAGLVHGPCESVRRVVVLAILVAWLPLVVLSLTAGGQAVGDVPFFYDIETNVRFLIAVPVLIAAELVVHQRLRSTVGQFIVRGIIVPDDVPRFDGSVRWTLRLRDAWVVEGALLAIVYTIGHYVWRRHFALASPSWYRTSAGSEAGLTPAGLWLAFVSIPLWQFLLLRWYLRLTLLFLFLWRISRLRLYLVATHPDKAGGLGFVGNSAYAFAYILFAQGTVVAGAVANEVFHQNQDLLSFKMVVAGSVIFQLVSILAPLTMFTPHLLRAKRQGSREFGLLANSYVREFDQKWFPSEGAGPDDLLGNSDLQSLAALASTQSVISAMRPVPFTATLAIELALAAVAPLLPVLVVVLPLEPVVDRLIRVVF
jgi:hypothetical protein